jgi:hypothetical protein
MRLFSKLNERELDRILAGKATGGDFGDLATFFRELRRNLDKAPTPAVEALHLARIFEEALARQSSAPDPQTPTRRGIRLRNPFRRLAARATIAAVGLAALAGFGGAAYAGVLPTSIQGEVAHLVRHVGIVLPDNSHHSPAPGTGSIPSTSHTGQPGQGSSSQGGGTQGNTGSTEGQSDNSHSGGAQGNSQTTDGHQGSSQSGNSGSQHTERNGNQGAQPSTGQRQQNKQGANVGAGAGGDQQGNGAFNGNGN